MNNTVENLTETMISRFAKVIEELNQLREECTQMAIYITEHMGGKKEPKEVLQNILELRNNITSNSSNTHDDCSILLLTFEDIEREKSLQLFTKDNDIKYDSSENKKQQSTGSDIAAHIKRDTSDAPFNSLGTILEAAITSKENKQTPEEHPKKKSSVYIPTINDFIIGDSPYTQRCIRKQNLPKIVCKTDEAYDWATENILTAGLLSFLKCLKNNFTFDGPKNTFRSFKYQLAKKEFIVSNSQGEYTTTPKGDFILKLLGDYIH